MRRVLIVVIGVFALAAGLWLARDDLGALTGPSSNARIAAASSAAQKAADDFAARAAGSETSGQPPRAADASVKELLDRIYDTGVLRREPPGFDDLSAIGDWLNAVHRVVTIYAMAGTGVTDAAKAADNASVGAIIEKNIVSFAPEYGGAIDAQLKLIQTEAELVTVKFGTDPTKIDDQQRRQRFERLRDGLNKVMGATLAVIAIPELDESWRLARVRALEAIAPKAAPLLEPDDAKRLNDMALELAEADTDPQVQAGLKRFAAAFPA
jgi:hypothetical protein